MLVCSLHSGFHFKSLELSSPVSNEHVNVAQPNMLDEKMLGFGMKSLIKIYI